MLCGNKIDIQREVKTEEGQKLAEKEKMLFFEVSAKNSINVSHMIYSCIAELPFFAQFEIKDKNRLIEDLEAVNKNREQNSIYDIVKGKTGLNGSTLNINGQNVEATDTIKKEKKNCKC